MHSINFAECCATAMVCFQNSCITLKRNCILCISCLLFSLLGPGLALIYLSYASAWFRCSIYMELCICLLCHSVAIRSH